MKRYSVIIAFISLFSSFGFAQDIDPSQLVKKGSDRLLLTGDDPGERFFDYKVNGEVKFRVLERFAYLVDEMISHAQDSNLMIRHVDPEVNYLYDEELIYGNIICVGGENNAGI